MKWVFAVISIVRLYHHQNVYNKFGKLSENLTLTSQHLTHTYNWTEIKCETQKKTIFFSFILYISGQYDLNRFEENVIFCWLFLLFIYKIKMCIMYIWLLTMFKLYFIIRLGYYYYCYCQNINIIIVLLILWSKRI